MANEVIERRGLELVMVTMHVKATDLARAISGLRGWSNFRGAIVTMPHKSAIVPMLDEVSDEVEEAGACNVIRRESDGRLVGALFDGEGLVAGLLAHGHMVAGNQVLLAGAGGAGAAIAFSLARHGARRITIVNRTVRKSAALAQRVHAAFVNCECVTSADESAPYDLVINATSLGMRPGDALPLSTSMLRPGVLVADIVVSTERTTLMVRAEQLGCDTYAGRHMLATQIDWMIDFMLR